MNQNSNTSLTGQAIEQPKGAVKKPRRLTKKERINKCWTRLTELHIKDLEKQNRIV